MPRAAFRQVWDRLKEGKPVAALVKNLAKDGLLLLGRGPDHADTAGVSLGPV